MSMPTEGFLRRGRLILPRVAIPQNDADLNAKKDLTMTCATDSR